MKFLLARKVFWGVSVEKFRAPLGGLWMQVLGTWPIPW